MEPDFNDLLTRLKHWAPISRDQVMRGFPSRLESDLSEAAAEIERLRNALTPFANAWNTVTANEVVVRSCSLAQIGSLCEREISGADFQRASLSLQPQT